MPLLYNLFKITANTGGLLGLCLGFSALSLLEVIYFLTIRAFFKARLKQKALKRVADKCVKVWKRLRGKLSEPEEDNRVLPFVTKVEYLPSWREHAEKTRQNNGQVDLIVGEVAPYYMNKKNFGLIDENI